MSRSPTLPPAAWLAAAAVGFVSLVIYVRTLAPSVHLVDSGELTLAAWCLGVAHPPGFPLYAILAHLATWIPVGSVAVRVNFASAIFGAAAAGAVSILVAEIVLQTSRSRPGAEVDAGRSRRKPSRRRTGDAAPPPWLPNWPLVTACVVAGLLLACARTMWAFATVAEVYTLNTLLIVAIAALLFRWRRAVLDPPAPRRDGPLYAAGLLTGLALGVHHVTVALTIPALVFVVAATCGRRFLAGRAARRTALCLVAGLSIYLYLPIAAARSPVLNWGNPRSPGALVRHVAGYQYSTSLSFSAEVATTELRRFLRYMGREFGPWWGSAGLVLAVIGYARAARVDRTAWWFLLLVPAVNLAYCVNYQIPEDKDAYHLPVVAALSVAAGLGAQATLEAARRAARRRAAAWALVALPIAAPAIAFASSLPYANRSRSYVADDYLANVLSTVPPSGMVLTRDWQFYGPYLYAREVEEVRRDAIVVDVNLLRRSWYFEYLERAYPQLLRGVPAEVAPFLEDLRGWERDPARYDRDAGLNRRINERFYRMILAFVSWQRARGAVHVTQEVALATDGADRELARALGSAYQYVPHHLTFELVTEPGFKVPPADRAIMRGIADRSLRFEPDGVVRQKIVPAYAGMLLHRARYLMAHGMAHGALEAVKRAAALDPAYPPTLALLQEIEAAAREARPR
jgi:hypothetical protein